VSGNAQLRRERRHQVADKGTPTPLLVTLLALTTVSGLVDAVCYLGLGRVFTANMTGNVVVFGFAVAGARGFSVTATLTSLAFFVIGAFCAGRAAPWLARDNGVRYRLLLVAMGTEACFVAIAALIAAVAATVATGWARYVDIALLAFAMGVRNATVRRLAVPDLTTTVLTMTLTGLAADATFARGEQATAAFRRAAAVVAMLIGAIVGAALFLHQRAALPLLIAALIVTVAGVVLRLSTSGDATMVR
jgi:uncharacterized membrane protein YoaK (UPF0700 family)